ncbi:MAG TPA: septum formation initiator family protein [Acidobacteriaceae bacterium]
MKQNRQFVSRSRMEPYVVRAGETVMRSWPKLATGAAAVLAVMLGFHVFFGQDGIFLYQQKRHDARDYSVQIKNLQIENDRLKTHVDELQNDPAAIERQARQELHYTRPGEVIVTLPDAPVKK